MSFVPLLSTPVVQGVCCELWLRRSVPLEMSGFRIQVACTSLIPPFHLPGWARAHEGEGAACGPAIKMSLRARVGAAASVWALEHFPASAGQTMDYSSASAVAGYFYRAWKSSAEHLEQQEWPWLIPWGLGVLLLHPGQPWRCHLPDGGTTLCPHKWQGGTGPNPSPLNTFLRVSEIQISVSFNTI